MKTYTALATVLLLLCGIGCSTEPSSPPPSSGKAGAAPAGPGKTDADAAGSTVEPAGPAGKPDATAESAAGSKPAAKTPAGATAEPKGPEMTPAASEGPAIPDGTATPAKKTSASKKPVAEKSPGPESVPGGAESSSAKTMPAKPVPGHQPDEAGPAGGTAKAGKAEPAGPKKVETPAAAFAEFNRLLFQRIQKRIAEESKKSGGSSTKDNPGESSEGAKPESGNN